MKFPHPAPRPGGDGVLPGMAGQTDTVTAPGRPTGAAGVTDAAAPPGRGPLRVLLGEAPAPLERLLVERVVSTWLGLHFAESVHARTMQTRAYDQGAYYQERVVRYHKMHLAAIRALAQLRRVAVTVARVLEPDGRHVEAARVEG
jgi:hypothetical protein